MILVKSAGIKKIPHVDKFFSEPLRFIGWYSRESVDSDTKIAGWGRRPSFYKAQKYARKHNIAVITLEDGFIRSAGLGVEGYCPLSLIVDDQGIYFDAYQPSLLESLINTGGEEKDRALAAMEKIRKYQLSKYNHAPKISLNISKNKKNVLIVDQTLGDQSIRFSGATQNSFLQMLQQAKETHPDDVLWLKVHPDVIAGKKRGHFDFKELASDAQIRVVAQDCNPIALLEQMDEVYVVSSHMGFEALMLGKTVHCFGVPWYAGWGLTNDCRAPLEILQTRRQVQRSLTQLFSAAYFYYARYVNPNTGQPCELEEVFELLATQKKWTNSLNGEIQAWGFSPWKRSFIQQYLKQPANHVTFEPSPSSVIKLFKQKQHPNHVVVWGYKEPEELKAVIRRSTAKVWRMEDGFIRSIGLGANLIRPLSLVLDDQGIYYDPSQPSRLESILNTIQLSPAQQQRAQQLCLRMVEQQLSKYNVGEPEDWPDIPVGKTVILVPGQVEDDASVMLGGCGIFTNLELLQAVRANNPEAWIIYKPHPDVEAGLRPGKISTQVLTKYSNSVIYKLDMPSCLEKVDEVHTISSLTGFEALLRQKKVHCYGLPFYAGWGLTNDRLVCGRRTRRLTLDELVHGVLVDYPLYKLPHGRDYLTSPEQVMDYIVQQRSRFSCQAPEKRSWLARLRALLIYRR